jgi:hypothetical protein
MEEREPLEILGKKPQHFSGRFLTGIVIFRGGEVARTAARGGGEVPDTAEISAAPHNLGRRGDFLLLQGKVQTGERKK